jgi:hypothetical protein
LESLIEAALIAVYACRGIPTDETCNQVVLEELPQLLDDDASWIAPDEGEIGIWYDTGDEGFDAYREASGWQ